MSDVKHRVLKNIKEIRVLNDPYRQEILSTMTILGKPATSKEIATAMKEAPSKVNYHLKVLEKYKFVELDHTENINGIIAKYYRRLATNFNVDLKKENKSFDKWNAVISMTESLFNNIRDKHVKRIIGLQNINKEIKEEDKGTIISSKLYLSESEIEEINNLINKFTSNEKEGRNLHNFFLAYIKEQEDE